MPRASAGRLRALRGVLVVNPSRPGAREAASRAAAICLRHLDDVECLKTGAPGDAVDLVAGAVATAWADGKTLDVVVVVGGDGTVREAAEGLARGLGRWPGGDASAAGHRCADRGGSAPALAIVPAGRGNSAYRALWGDADWPEALARGLSGDRARVRAVDLLRVVEHDRATVLGANTGLIARIAAITATLPADAGEDRYWGAAAQVLGDLEHDPGRVVLDGETVLEGPLALVTIGGVRRFGGGAFELLPRSCLDDGLLDVCAVGQLDQAAVQELSAVVTSGGHLGHPAVRYATGRRATVERTDGRPLAFEHDGDVWDVGASVTLEVVPAACPLLAPQAPPGP
jgi:diacylglycerol kinase (ATP)